MEDEKKAIKLAREEEERLTRRYLANQQRENERINRPHPNNYPHSHASHLHRHPFGLDHIPRNRNDGDVISAELQAQLDAAFLRDNKKPLKAGVLDRLGPSFFKSQNKE